MNKDNRSSYIIKSHEYAMLSHFFDDNFMKILFYKVSFNFELFQCVSWYTQKIFI